MKNTIQKLSVTRVSLIIVAITLIIFASSCSKSSTSNADFTGTYYGTLIVSGVITESDTIVITNGSTSSSIVMFSKTSRGSTYTVNGTVSGNLLNVPSQSVYVAALTTTYAVNGTGSLNGTSLSINETWSGNALSFNGTKQ